MCHSMSVEPWAIGRALYLACSGSGTAIRCPLTLLATASVACASVAHLPDISLCHQGLHFLVRLHPPVCRRGLADGPLRCSPLSGFAVSCLIAAVSMLDLPGARGSWAPTALNHASIGKSRSVCPAPRSGNTRADRPCFRSICVANSCIMAAPVCGAPVASLTVVML